MKTMFVNNGQLTDDGKRVIAYVEGVLAEAGNDPEKLNGLPGYMKHYHINTLVTHVYTPEQWVDQLPSMAEAAMSDIRYFDEQERKDEQVNTVTEQNNTLAQELEALRKEFKAYVEASARKPKKETPAVTETEAETESGD